jgi:outer membrane protein W
MTRLLVRFVCFALFLMAILPSRVFAQDHERGRFRAWVGADCRCVLSDNETFTDPVFGTAETRQKGAGFALGVDTEYLPSKWFGIGTGLGYSRVTTEFSHSNGVGVQEDKLGMMPLFFSANVHFVNNDKLDLYGGWLAAYMFYLDDPTYAVPGLGTFVVEKHNEFTPKGFNFGADISVKNRWAVNVAFRMVNADADESHNLPVDPTYITVGVTKKF